jgi:hypothetical protein
MSEFLKGCFDISRLFLLLNITTKYLQGLKIWKRAGKEKDLPRNHID